MSDISRARIEILGDSSSYQRAVKEAAVVTDKLGLDMKKLSITAESSARAQVAASVRKTARLKNEIAVYRQVAAQAKKGSREQIAATNLATRAEKQLGGSLAATRAESRAFGSSIGGAERDVNRLGRGALAGSGAFRAFGRSIAFASAYFIGGAGLVYGLKSSVGAAEDLEKAQRSLAVVIKKTGGSVAATLPQVERWARAQVDVGVSTVQAEQGLARATVITGSAAKGMRAYTEALLISKATGKGFNQVLIAAAKANNGSTSALARYIGKIQKGTTAQELYNRVTGRFGGQAKANTLASDKLRASLANVETEVGSALLPTISRYANELTDWLGKSNNQERLQRDINRDFKLAGQIFGTTATAVKTVTGAFGGLKNTLELVGAAFIGLKIAKLARELGLLATAERAVGTSAVVSNIAQYTTGITASGTAAATSAGEVSALSLALRQLGLVGVVTTLVEVVIHRKSIDNFGKKIVDGFTHAQQGAVANALAKTEAKIANLVPGVHVDWRSLTKAVDDQTKKNPPVLSPTFKVNPKIQDVTDQTFKQMFPEGFKKTLKDVLTASGVEGGAAATATAAQKTSLNNTFFDNAIARILLRGGLGQIGQQIGALEKADRLIAARIKVTKDVTRRLRLEDELLQNQAQIQSLRSQQAANALQARQQAAQEFLDALQFGVTKAQATASFRDDISALQALQNGIRKEISVQGKTLALQQQLFDVGQQIRQARKDQAQARIDQVTRREFRMLGLTSTGDELAPTKRNLRKRLGQLTANVRASDLDSPKLESELARFRRVLAKKIVPPDIRKQIREMMDQIAQELQNSGRKNEAKFRRSHSDVLLAGLGLTPEQTRLLRSRMGQMSAGGVVPGAPSLAFSQAGPQTIVNTTVTLDGRVVAKNTTAHQQKDQRRRSVGRRGPYAGRH